LDLSNDRISGVGQALLEQSETDPVLGRFLHRNYSGYLVPTNADIPKLETLFVATSTRKRARSAPRASGSLLPYQWRRRSRTPCITRPASECVTYRSPWRNCC